jgi:hypothetical protein
MHLFTILLLIHMYKFIEIYKKEEIKKKLVDTKINYVYMPIINLFNIIQKWRLEAYSLRLFEIPKFYLPLLFFLKQSSI